MRPGWVKPCTCGRSERGAYCPECRGFGDGYDGGTWERPRLAGVNERSRPLIRASGPREDGPAPASSTDTWCPGHNASARIVGNAAYCNECDGRLRPIERTYREVGTGH